MTIIDIKFKSAPNQFISELQDYCKALMKSPFDNGIRDLFCLKKLIADHAESINSKINRCATLEFLEFEVHSYLTFEVFNLIYDNDTMLISLTARKTEYEISFLDYDNKIVN